MWAITSIFLIFFCDSAFLYCAGTFFVPAVFFGTAIDILTPFGVDIVSALVVAIGALTVNLLTFARLLG